MNCELTGTPDQPLNPPDCGTDDHPTKLFDAVMRLLDTTPMLSDYDEELCLVANQVNIILNEPSATDAEKLSYIRDVYYSRKSEIADDVVKYHETWPQAKAIAKLAMGD
jgi:hypothetical protein